MTGTEITVGSRVTHINHGDWGVGTVVAVATTSKSMVYVIFRDRRMATFPATICTKANLRIEYTK